MEGAKKIAGVVESVDFEDCLYSDWFLSVLDISLSCIVVAPLVVGFWRATWEYMCFFPDSYPLWSTLVISTAVHLAFTLARNRLVDIFTDNKKIPGLIYTVLSRVYIYVFAVSCIMQWRSTWYLLEQHFGYDPHLVLLVTLPSLLLLSAFRLMENTLAPPHLIDTDFEPKSVFGFPTMFQSGSRSLWLYIADCLLSVFVVGTLVVFVWRGVWCLLDIYLFPEDAELSAWGSMAIGYALVFSTFATQPLMKSLVTRLKGFWRLFAVDVYLLFSFCGTVNVWRGVWNLLNLFFLPAQPVLSFWVTHVFCFLLLVFINSSNSILVRGVYIDAEEEGAQCVDFPCYYLRLFFQTKRKKKLLRQMQKRQVAALVRRKSEAEVHRTTPELNNDVHNAKQTPVLPSAAKEQNDIV